MKKDISSLFMNTILLLLMLWQKTRVLRSVLNLSKCRFYPSCSDYCTDAIKRFGIVNGLVITIKRLVRCNPLYEGALDEIVK